MSIEVHHMRHCDGGKNIFCLIFVLFCLRKRPRFSWVVLGFMWNWKMEKDGEAADGDQGI